MISLAPAALAALSTLTRMRRTRGLLAVMPWPRCSGAAADPGDAQREGHHHSILPAAAEVIRSDHT
jgi:hypothetical protein